LHNLNYKYYYITHVILTLKEKQQDLIVLHNNAMRGGGGGSEPTQTHNYVKGGKTDKIVQGGVQGGE